MRPSTIRKTRSLQTHIEKFNQYVCKDQFHSFFRTTTEILSRPNSLTIKVSYDLFNYLGSFRNILSGKEIPESSRLEFLLANSSTLSDVEDNMSRPLHRGGIIDLLITLLAVCLKSKEPSFWDVVDCFVLLVYASSAPSRTLSQ